MKTIEVLKGDLNAVEGYIAREAEMEKLPVPKQMPELEAKYEEALKRADEAKAETAYFPSIPAADLPSTMFQAISVVYRAMKKFQASHEYPQQIRIICSDDEIFKLYMVVWNLYYAEDKSKRMNDGRWD